MNKNNLRYGTLLLAAALSGCNSVPVEVNLLQSIEPLVGQSPALDRQLTFHVNGLGRCGGISIDWGDGATQVTGTCPTLTDATGRKLFQCDVTHLYTGWGGGKTITATTTQNSSCEGRASLRFNVAPAKTVIAFARPGPNVCDAVPGKPPLANRTLVKITTVPTNTPCGGIWYQNVNPHCYDAEGGTVTSMPPAGSPAPPFPFPGMRSYSLVLRVGAQLVQGGTNMGFTTNQAGALELCVNEPDSTAGNGGYEVHIATDQLGLPPP